MTQEQFEREKTYRVTMSIAGAMLKSGLINNQDYQRIKVMMLEKYRPLLGLI